MSGLICVQTVCKDYEQPTPVGTILFVNTGNKILAKYMLFAKKTFHFVFNIISSREFQSQSIPAWKLFK